MVSEGESAAQRVLRLPELLAVILDFASKDDGGASVLAAAMLVNRLWAATALPLRWYRVPHAALHAIPAQRCAVYDTAIRAVDLQLWRARPVKKAWTLPRLHTLSLAYGSASRKNADDAAAAYVSRWAETLTRVTIRPAASAKAAKAAKAAVARRRQQQARRSRVSNRRSGRSHTGPQPWSNLLPNASRLRSDRSADIVAQLARCAALRNVTLSAPTVRYEAVRAIEEAQIVTPFPALVAWSSAVDVAAIDGFCRMIASVTQLELTVESMSMMQEQWACFARLRHLQSFTFRLSSTFWASGLLQLRGLSLLRELNVQTPIMFDVFTDDDLRTLLRGLVSLRLLRLRFDSNFSSSAFVIPGEHCPQLTRLALDVRCSFGALARRCPDFRPLFPLLDSLMVTDAAEDGTLRYVCPNRNMVGETMSSWN
jgi:hypothetical protein